MTDGAPPPIIVTASFMCAADRIGMNKARMECNGAVEYGAGEEVQEMVTGQGPMRQPMDMLLDVAVIRRLRCSEWQ